MKAAVLWLTTEESARILRRWNGRGAGHCHWPILMAIRAEWQRIGSARWRLESLRSKGPR